jgi:hypothetical protein
MSYDWTLTRDQIITEAYEDIGVIEEGETPSPEQMASGARRLEGIIKRLQTKNIYLWTQEWVTQVLTTSSVVTNGGTTYRCIKGHTASATDEPGVGADWTTYWIEDSMATGAVVWVLTTAYTTIGEFNVAADTIGISDMFYRDIDDDTPIDLIRMDEYLKISNKSDLGTPKRAVFHKLLGAAGLVYLYDHPDSTDYVIHYNRVRKLQDFDIGTANFDGPEAWIPLLVKELAYSLCGPYTIPISERRTIKEDLKELHRDVRRDNTEDTDGDFIEGAF